MLSRRSLLRILPVLLLLTVLLYRQQRHAVEPVGAPAPDTTRVIPSARVTGGEEEILRAYDQRRSGVWVEGHGTVDTLLPDDNEGPRHQRFILRLSSGHTVLVSHNVDLAPRLPDLRVGDEVSFRGEYVWNARGGLVHWTHHDPDGKEPGGWLELGGRRYR